MNAKLSLAALLTALAASAYIASSYTNGTASVAAPAASGAAMGSGLSEVAVSGAPLPSMLTVITPVGSAQANLPFTMGIPMSGGTLDSSHSIQVKDGATTLSCDENNRASDLSPSVRFVSLTCIIPSARSGEVKQLVPTVVAGAPETGTDIAISDITAAFTAASSYDVPVDFTNINGVPGTWTASLAAALASGHNGWINKSTNTVMGKWRSGGGLVTEYLVFAPATKSGVADAQIHVIYDVICYKAARAAVNASTNPILGCKINPIIENGYIQASAPVDNYYGLSVGRNGNVANFGNSTPAIGLTLGQSAAGPNVKITAALSAFTINSIGQVIADGTGVAVINGYVDATHAQAVIYKAFASTSIGSGTYTLYGMNHPWASRYKFETFFGFAHNPPTVESGNVYIGAAWNNGKLIGGPGSYLVASKLLPNYSFSNSGYANNLTNISATGMNPMGYIDGGGQFGAGGHMGDTLLYLETSGQSPMIGIIPDWDVKAIFRYDGNAAPVIFGNANRWATLPIAWRDQNTGLNVSPCNAGTAPTCAGTINWVMFDVYAGKAIKNPSHPMTPWSMDAFAHDPDDFYVAGLLTGDFFWTENLQVNAVSAPMWMNSGGTGLSRTQYADPRHCCGLQERAAAWSFRTIVDAAVLTPDRTPSVLGISKAVMNGWVTKQTDDANYGFKHIFLDNTGAGANFWGANGPHYTQINDNSYPQFEVGYASLEWSHASEQGMLNANGIAARNWWLQNQIGMVSDKTQTRAEYVVRWQYGHLFDESSSCPGTHVTSWKGAYNSSEYYWDGATQWGVGLARTASATLTLSATSGPSINATLSGGNYLTTTAYYVGAWISTADGGVAQIVSVSDPNHFVVSTAASHNYFRSGGCNTFTGKAFGSTSYSNTQFRLPAPAPGDPIGTDWANYLATGGGDGGDYFQLQQIGVQYAKEYGLSGGAAAYDTIFGLNGGKFFVGGQPYKWQIKPR